MINPITISATIEAPIEKVWEYWTLPEHITKWCQASADWHAPRADNDLRVGGRFTTRMESRDGQQGFDFSGTYTEIVGGQKIEYVMDGADQRKVKIDFSKEGDKCQIVETFDPENENPLEMQQVGWQAILVNFKNYVEAAN